MVPKKRTDKLPPYVYRLKGRYVIREYNPETRKQREFRLCPGTASMSEVWAAYEARQGKSGTFSWLSSLFLESAQFGTLAENTRRDYQGASRRVCSMKLSDGRTLGDLPLYQWTPPLVQRWQDRRAKDAPVTANREKAYIARVFAWAVARGYASSNPAKAIPRVRERPRTRYVTDDEYLARLALARPAYLVPVMELAYLLRARLSEVLDLTEASIQPEGLLLTRRKGSRPSLTLWTPRLCAAVALALGMYDGPWLIGGRARMKESTIQTAWQRAPWTTAPFTIHDLKAKGVTDTLGDKLAASGHRDPRMLAVYDRLPGRSEATR